jgi:HK97 family phage major capsid protein
MDGFELAAVRRARSALNTISTTKGRDDIFRVTAMIHSHEAQSFGKVPSYESGICTGLASKYGHALPNYHRVPDDIFFTRDLVAATSSAGGFLTDSTVTGYVPALQAAGTVAGLAAVVTAGPGGVLVPRGSSAVTAYWLATESSTITESSPVFGQASATPKLLGVHVEISRQSLLQSNSEEVVRIEMRNAAIAAVDTAILQATGASGQPLGIVNTAGIGTFTGASLNQAAARNAQRDVAEANAMTNPDALAYVTTPAVAETLSTRQRFTGSDRALWEGKLSRGEMEGALALATTACPSATVVYGDFSTVWLVQWAGGIQIQIDPFTKFKEGIVGVRLLLPIDVIVTKPSAFSIATSVT